MLKPMWFSNHHQYPLTSDAASLQEPPTATAPAVTTAPPPAAVTDPRSHSCLGQERRGDLARRARTFKL